MAHLYTEHEDGICTPACPEYECIEGCGCSADPAVKRGEYRVCPECNGKGGDPYCRKCFITRGSPIKREKCPDCDGPYSHDFDPCKSCGGTGREKA